MNKYKSMSTSKFLFSFLKPYKKRVLGLLFVLLLISLLDVYLPFKLGEIIDIIASSDGNDVTSIVIISTLIYFGLNILSSISQIIYQYFLQVTGSRVVYDIRKETYSHVQGLSMDYFVRTPVGLLVSRIVNDTNKLNDMYSGALINLIKNLTIILIMLVFIFVINVKLAIATVIIIPAVAIASILFKKFSSKGFIEERKRMSNINIFLSENLSGMYLTQAFNQEAKSYEDFKKLNRKHYNAFKFLIHTFATFRPLLYLLKMIGTMLVLYFGSKLVLNGEITIGLLVTFMLYSERLFTPIVEITDQLNVIVQAFSASINIKNILAEEASVKESNNPIVLDEFKGNIEFKNVFFRYEDDEDYVLQDVSFKVSSGESLAFVGATGSGKTTILKLICRYYDVTTGEILIDGINIKDISLKSLRENIGQMLQDVTLFSGTIKENMTLFNDKIAKVEIDEVVDYLGARKIIDEVDGGYNHLVREKGSNFSAGQRQIISFVRSLLYKPNLLILDEATANIDSESEVVIQEALYKMMNIGTMLIVAHRLATIQHCDNILVLDKGNVVEIGNHQQLLKNKNLYYELYQIQFTKDQTEEIKN